MRQFNLRFGLAGPGARLGPPPTEAGSRIGLTERGRLDAYDRDIFGCACIVAHSVPGRSRPPGSCRFGDRRGGIDGP